MRSLLAITFTVLAARSVAAGAQRIDLQSRPIRVNVVDGRLALGVITYVATDTQGRALLLGGPSKQHLFLLNPDGRSSVPPVSLSEIGVPLAWPVAAAFDGANSIAIIDGQSPRWARLHFGGGRWAMDTLSSTNLSGVSSMCSMDGRRYVMGKVGLSHASGAVHEVSGSGAVKRSFGKPFGDIVNPAVAYGHLLCQSMQGIVVVASRLYPELRAYTMAGEERWSIPLPSFQSMGFEVEGRLVRFVLPPDSLWDQTVSLFTPAPDIVAVQIGRLRGRAASRYLVMRTVFLSASTGRVLGEQRGLPLVRAATPKWLYAVMEENAQELQIYSYTFRVP